MATGWCQVPNHTCHATPAHPNLRILRRYTTVYRLWDRTLVSSDWGFENDKQGKYPNAIQCCFLMFPFLPHLHTPSLRVYHGTSLLGRLNGMIEAARTPCGSWHILRVQVSDVSERRDKLQQPKYRSCNCLCLWQAHHRQIKSLDSTTAKRRAGSDSQSNLNSRSFTSSNILESSC